MDLDKFEREERIIAYTNKMRQKVDGFLSSTLLKFNDDFSSDCTVNQLGALSEVLEVCEVNPIRTIDGSAANGEGFVEFYVEEESLWETVMALFYEKMIVE